MFLKFQGKHSRFVHGTGFLILRNTHDNTPYFIIRNKLRKLPPELRVIGQNGKGHSKTRFRVGERYPDLFFPPINT